jgi:hypothetical protein
MVENLPEEVLHNFAPQNFLNLPKVIILPYIPYFEKIKGNIIKSSCCLYVCVSPIIVAR